MILLGQGAAEEFATLAHELAHSLLHQREQRTETSKRVREPDASRRSSPSGKVISPFSQEIL